MNKSIKLFLAAISLSTALIGCGTTPNSNYYLLNNSSSPLATGSTPSLGIGPIVIPEYLNRNSLVYKRDGNRLHISKFERWAEPLDYGIMRIIRMNLASLLDTQYVQSYPWSSSERPEYGVEITVLTLDASDTEARLVAEWHISMPRSNEAVIRRISELQLAMPEGPIAAIDIEPAYSNLFYQLSEIIAAAVSNDIKNRLN